MAQRKDEMKKLDALFSNYVRTKYAVNGKVACASCGNWDDVAQMTCGHHMKRRNSLTRWDEVNAAPQCYICNTQDKSVRSFLVREYGISEVERVELQSHQTFKLDRVDMDIKKKELKAKLRIVRS